MGTGRSKLMHSPPKMNRSKTYILPANLKNSTAYVLWLMNDISRVARPGNSIREEPQHLSLHLLYTLHSWWSELYNVYAKNSCPHFSCWPLTNMYFFPVAPWGACRAVQEEDYSHHRQPLPIHQNQDSGADFLIVGFCISWNRWPTRSRSSWPRLKWPLKTYRWGST